MAKVYQLVDDLDGTPATQTVQFDAFGRRYSIDLSDANAAELNAVLTKYASAGTEIVSPNRIAAKAIRTPSELNAIRGWARGQGHTISDKGRIPEHIIRQFEKAQEDAEVAAERRFAEVSRRACMPQLVRDDLYENSEYEPDLIAFWDEQTARCQRIVNAREAEMLHRLEMRQAVDALDE